MNTLSLLQGTGTAIRPIPAAANARIPVLRKPGVLLYSGKISSSRSESAQVLQGWMYPAS
jgi:hypothetical protein